MPQSAPIHFHILLLFGKPTRVVLNGNILTGSIPDNFLANSITTEKLVDIRLNNNKLVGELPADLARFNKLQIDV